MRTYHEIRADFAIPDIRKDKEGYHAAMRTVARAFYLELRNEYPSLTPQAFDIIYNKAYSDGHAEGFDQIAMIFDDLFDLVEAVKKES